MMKHLKKIMVVKIAIYLFLILILLLLIMQTSQNSLPETQITLENTTILGKFLGA